MSRALVLRIAAGLFGLLVVSTGADAQRRCVKGIPCGNTCISASKTCRVGTGSATSARPAQSTEASKNSSDSALVATYLSVTSPSKATSSGTDTLYVGSRVDGVYFLRTCIAAQDLAQENRRYFKTEQDAVDAKYRRSRVPGC